MDQIRRFEQLDDILTVDEAATFLRVGRSLVYEAVRAGTIASVRIGRRILVPKAGLQKLIEASERNTESHEGLYRKAG